MRNFAGSNPAWMKTIKRISVLLVLVCSFGLLGFTIHADQGDLCQMEISLAYDHQPLQGFDVALYKVADLNMNDQTFQALEQYKMILSENDLKNLDIAANNEAVSEKLLSGLKETGVSADFTGVSDINGICSFSGIPSGLYLFAVDNKNLFMITPGLMSVPQYSEADDSWIYNIKVEAKISKGTEPETPTTPPVPPAPPETNKVKTGDNSNMINYLIAFTASIGAVLLIMLLYRKKD